MADVLVKHAFFSPYLDGPDATKLQPSHQNAALLLSAGVDGQIVMRDSLSATGASWLDPATLVTGLGLVLNTRSVNGHALSADVTVTKADLGLGSVENTALSTWAGSANLVTLGAATATKLTLAAISTAALGNVFKGADRFIHNYAAPGSDGLNTFMGTQAGNFTMSPAGGNSNLASTNAGFGHLVLRDLTTGRDNSGFGKGALTQTTSGELNTALGVDSLTRNTTGSRNVGCGVDALLFNTTGSDNTACGDSALLASTVGGNNTAVGQGACSGNTSGAENAAVGWATLLNVNGNFNTAIGSQAGRTITSGSSNTFLGSAAGKHASQMLGPTNSMALGANTFTTASNQVVLGDTAVTSTILRGTVQIPALIVAGATTLGAALIQGLNVGLGSNAVAGNTALGVGALVSATLTGGNNTAVGAGALSVNTSGTSSVAIGFGALVAQTTGGSNTAVGLNALASSQTATSNVAVGLAAGVGITTGGSNTAIGYDSLSSNSVGTGNVVLGKQAGKFETGSNAFYVDNQSRVNTAGDKAGALLYGTFNATPATQTLKINAKVTIGVAIPAFVAADKYLVVDSAGNVHVSALGPAS